MINLLQIRNTSFSTLLYPHSPPTSITINAEASDAKTHLRTGFCSFSFNTQHLLLLLVLLHSRMSPLHSQDAITLDYTLSIRRLILFVNHNNMIINTFQSRSVSLLFCPNSHRHHVYFGHCRYSFDMIHFPYCHYGSQYKFKFLSFPYFTYWTMVEILICSPTHDLGTI